MTTLKDNATLANIKAQFDATERERIAKAERSERTRKGNETRKRRAFLRPRIAGLFTPAPITKLK